MVDTSLYATFLVAAFALCVTPGPDMMHVPAQLMVLGLTIVVMGFAVDGSIGLLSGKLSALLRRSRRVARGLNIFSGTVFTGLALRLAASPK
ncbi:hypothetical protein [Streptomyces sp. NPDC002088]|uniref:hypothetical protein n=1 Tax=Streptomyces sp. NPDC002088 TaxID=3154665 RepID=UPI00331AD825